MQKILKRRKIKHLNKKQVLRVLGNQELECSKCKDEIVMVSKDTSSVICSKCVQMMIPPPVEVKKVKKLAQTDYPRGWHRKKLFISNDGKYFTKGKEITKEQADKLNVPTGTTKKTKSVKKKTSKTKRK
jgi:ribosomal protein S27E